MYDTNFNAFSCNLKIIGNSEIMTPQVNGIAPPVAEEDILTVAEEMSNINNVVGSSQIVVVPVPVPAAAVESLLVERRPAVLLAQVIKAVCFWDHATINQDL
jgi:hypothetical protein